MEILMLARIQFASTTLFHFIFVPLSIGLAFIIAIMQTLYVVKKKEVYKKMTKFLGNFFLINFAVGVVTGIIQEFQIANNLTVYNAASGEYSLKLMTIVAFTMVPIILAYTIWSYYVFRKRVTDKEHLEY